MFRLSLILFIIISILLNCRTDIKPEKNDSFVLESRQSSGNSDIIPRISEYADYESIVSNQVDSFISDTLSDTMIINTQRTVSDLRGHSSPKISKKSNNNKNSIAENDYIWISEKPKTRQEAYQWAYKAYKMSLSEDSLLASRYIDRALDLYENGSLWTEKAKHALNAGNYEKAIMYCDASLRRHDHWDTEDRKRARLIKYRACEELYDMYPSELTRKAASKAFEEFANE
jgi:hypothetical protein